MSRASLILFISIPLILFAANFKKVEPVKGIKYEMPEDFLQMTDDDMAQNYPTYKKPLIMFNSPDKKADFGVNSAVNRWNNKNLSVLKDMYKSTISSVFTSVTFIQEGIVQINNRSYIVFEFNSELVDEKRFDGKATITRKYSYLLYTIYENKILVFNFTCESGSKGTWAPVAKRMMNSIEISNKLKLQDFEPFEVDRPLPKSNDPQMEMIRKMKDSKAKKQE